MGKLLNPFPTVEKLENEDFDETFAVAFITKEDAETFKAKIMKVSEVENVSVNTDYK